jgi:hypothetical protein
VEHHVGLEVEDHLPDALAVPHISDHPFGPRIRGEERGILQDVVERGLGAVEDEEVAGAEGRHAGADLGSDGPASPGDEHALATHEAFQPLAVDLDRGSQEQVLDLQRCQFGLAHAVAEALEP